MRGRMPRPTIYRLLLRGVRNGVPGPFERGFFVRRGVVYLRLSFGLRGLQREPLGRVRGRGRRRPVELRGLRELVPESSSRGLFAVLGRVVLLLLRPGVRGLQWDRFGRLRDQSRR